MELGIAPERAEGLLENLGAQTRSAHAEEHRVREAFPLRLLPDRFERRQVVELRLDDADPADPARLVGPGPERGVPRPQPPRAPPRVPLAHLRLDRRRERGGQRIRLGVDARLIRVTAAPLHGREELRERLGELPDPVAEQIVGDLRKRQSRPFERGEGLGRGLHALLEARPRAPVVPERGQRLGRHGVDGVRADQLLDIEHVAVARILGPGARPQHPLGPGAPGGE